MKLKAAFAISLLLFFVSNASSFERAVKVKPKKGAEIQSVRQDTNYYALVIGNNNYKHLPKLKTAVTDATEVERLLKSRYGFKTKLLLNATRKDILSTINEFRKQLGAKDNLLIYYAGHGEFDKTADKAYWLPVDALRDDPVDWIMADDITSNVKRISSKHILIVSDSCYSGTLTRSSAVELKTKDERDGYLNKMIIRPSRTLMASGGNEPVADSGGGNHSVFAYAFIKALEESPAASFTAEELFHGRIKAIVAGKADQVPVYSDIRNSGHEGGDFVFQLAKAYTGVPAAKAPEVELTEPSKGGFSIDDLEKQGQQIEKNKSAWNAKLKEMKNAYNQVQAYEKKSATADLKAAAWERFISSFGEDNPHSTEDDSMRAEAQERVGHWQAEQQKAEEKKLAMAPAKKFLDKITGSSYTDPSTGMEFVFVKGGCYQMGDTFGDGASDEKPVHEVCVNDFYMGKYEVTQGQWKAVMGNNPSYFKDCGDNCPVESVSWNDIQEFISKLNNKTGKNYKLPTEAEWEYAARSGGKSEKYSGGNDIDSVAWYGSNSGNKTHPVGQKAANGLGLYDMSGNVWQWVQDWYDGRYYNNSPRNNPAGPNSGQYRALRGGSWFNVAGGSRTANRISLNPDFRDNSYGFRLARTQ